MKLKDFGWVCTACIALGIFFHQMRLVVFSVCFFIVGGLVLVGGAVSLVVSLAPRLLSRFKAFRAWVDQVAPAATRISRPAVAVVVGVVVYFLSATPVGAYFRDKVSTIVYRRDASKAYDTGRQLYMEFSMTSFKAAENHFRAALQENPNYAKAHAALGELYATWATLSRYRGENTFPLTMKSLDESLTAITIEPNLFESHRSLAAALLQNGQAKLALEEAEKALAFRPDDRESLFYKWAAEGGEYDQSYIQSVLGDSSYEFLPALVRLGFNVATHGKSDEARALFDKAQAVSGSKGKDKDIPLVHVGRAYTYVNDAGPLGSAPHAGAIANAIVELKAAIDSDDRLIIAQSNLGNVYLAERQWADSLKYFDAALRIDPKYQVAAFNKALALYELGRVKEAEHAWKETEELAMDPEPRAVAFAKLSEAMRLSAMSRTGEARDAYRQAADAGHKANPELHFDNPDWCLEKQFVGPRGVVVLRALR